MEPYPLIFQPILKEKVWGGQTLKNFGKRLPKNTSIGESWELADLPGSIPNGKSVIANGALKGKTLEEAGIQVPLLIKYLDACDNLSVQVHPSEAYAKIHSDAHLKSEAWIILDATPEGTIYVGLTEGTTEIMLREAIEQNTVPHLLHAINVKKGECYYLPSGTCHALGAGVLVAEVQTPSDTTFRIWDWGRSGREMHIEQAIACIDFNSPALHFPEPIPLRSGDFLTTHFVDTPFFSIEQIKSTSNTVLDLFAENAPFILMVIEGHAKIQHQKITDAQRGTTILLPEGIKDATLLMPKDTVVLRIDLPRQQFYA